MEKYKYNEINYNFDKEIIKLVHSILNNANWTIETYNESILYKLMDLRGTPINANKILRDVEADWKDHLK